MAAKRLRTSILTQSPSPCWRCAVRVAGIRHSGTQPSRALSTETAAIPREPLGPPPGLATNSTQDLAPEVSITADQDSTTSAAEPKLPKLRGPRVPRDLFPRPQNPFQSTAPVTLYSFPQYAPVSATEYTSSQLLLPLRRDILHKAIIYEGDSTRQGTANTKWRTEVHGSGRKIRPQKGTGSARLGDKKSPMLRGGGVAFGPKPRDFSTDLPAKMYDLAWRTALSYRYRRGELVVVTGNAEIERDGPGAGRWVREMLAHNGWGREAKGSLILTLARRENLFAAMESEVEKTAFKGHAKCLTVEDVDVKDLLEMGRVIVERKALDFIFRRHSSDLKSKVTIAPSLRGEGASALIGSFTAA